MQLVAVECMGGDEGVGGQEGKGLSPEPPWMR